MQAAHSHQKNQWPVTNEISLIRNHDTIELRLTPSSMSGVFVRPGTPGPLLGFFNSRPAYFIRRCLYIFIILFPVVKTETE